MNKAKEIIGGIKNKDCRYSKVREVVLDLIIKNKKPLSYSDIQKFLDKKKLCANKATIYRELAFLKENKIIRELQFKDEKKYYEVMSDGHHHHIVCNKCKDVEHVELKNDLDKQENLIMKNNKFKVLSHSLEFYGLCRKCQLKK